MSRSVTKVLIPHLHDSRLVLFHYLSDLPQLAITEALGPGKPDGIEPKLRGRLIPLNMNMRWFGPFGGLKEQLVRAYIGYGWHAIHLSVSK